MKLSFITDEGTQDFEEAVRFAREQGLQGPELRSVEDKPIDRIPRTALRAWERRLREEGLMVSNIAGSFGKCRAGLDDMDKELEKLQRLCDAADIFGCETIRGFCFFIPDNGIPLSGERIKKELDKAEVILRTRGKKLLLEADPSVNTTNHGQLSKLLKLLDPEFFGAIYDPGNDLFDPEGEEPFPRGYEAVAERLAHVHVKDAVYDQAGRPVCVAPGKGLVPYREVLERLKNDGYEGWLSLEPHYRKDVRLTEEQMRLPQGASFSRGGLEAAAESAEAFKSLLEDIYG